MIFYDNYIKILFVKKSGSMWTRKGHVMMHINFFRNRIIISIVMRSFDILGTCLLIAKPLSKPMLCCCQLDHQGTNFNEILIKIQNISFTKMHLKTSSVKCRLFCPREMSWTCCSTQCVDFSKPSYNTNIWPRDIITYWKYASPQLSIMHRIWDELV